MKRVVLSLALLGCTKDHADREREEDAPRAPDAAYPLAAHPLAAHRFGPVATTPHQLFEDFTRPDADGLALLDKYAGGATFTATIKTVGVDEDGAPVVWIDVDGDNVMSLDFAPPPPQGLRAGSRLTVTCRIGGASGALMMVTGCLVRDV
jgi:hypothetical protein